ncbi:MAG: dephospho-CoA kinase [Thermobifida sp.]|nr:dephospho-CoA kinase [Thermobifida sp.]
MRAPRTQGPRRIIAVSGGIGSGKSSVTRVFASRGAVTADADAIARQILERGEPTLSEVARTFGGDLLKEDGSLDRALLASRVFGGEGASERVARLNAITHPVIEARAWSILRGAPEGSLAVYDIPLLIEGDHVDRFDAVVIVDAPIEERVKRLEGRGLSPEDARARIRAQASSQERRAIATIWIDNEGSADDLEEVARLVYERWLTPDAPVTD